MKMRAVSPLLATIVLIAIVVSAGIVVYSMISGWIDVYSSTLSIQPTSVNLVVADGKALLSVSVKNTGNKPLASIVVAGYDDNGKPFKLALSSAEPGQTSGNMLVIPLGVPNLVLDGSGNNNHGTIYGATWVDGKLGKALDFDGINDYIYVPRSPSLDLVIGDFSVCFWWKPKTTYDTFYGIVDEGHPSEGYLTDFSIMTTPSSWGKGILFAIHGSSGISQNLEAYGFTVSNWHHVHCVKRNDKLEAWVNGTLSASRTLTITPQLGTEPLRVGTYWSYYCSMTIDEIFVFKRAPSGSDDRILCSGIPLADGLVLWLPLDEGTSAPYAFTAGKNYALTLTAYSPDGSTTTQTIVVAATA